MDSYDEFLKSRKNLDLKEQFEIGKAELQRLKLWPEHAKNNWWSTSTTGHTIGNQPRMAILRNFSVMGTCEGLNVAGWNHYLRFSVTCTGKLGHIRISWKYIERYALLECKTVEEAFDDLNRGYAHPVPKWLQGGEATFLAVHYEPEAGQGKIVQPVYVFGIRKGNIYAELRVPAIKSAYFKDPKRQVVLPSMLKGTTEKSKKNQLPEKEAPAGPAAKDAPSKQPQSHTRVRTNQ